MDATTGLTGGSGRDHGERSPTEEPAPLDVLYVQCMPEAIGLAYLLTGDEVLAGELAEEAFVRGAGRFEHRLGRARFPTWLQRSVVTMFLLRERRADSEPVDADEADSSTEEANRSDGLWLALLELPPRERAAVVLRHCRGLSDEQVGEVMRCGARVARAIVARGLSLLDRSQEP
jgi:RNA polymerase sigma factor (sigma-70 family)